MSRFLAIDPDPSGPLFAVATVQRGGIKLERVFAWPEGEPPPTAPAALGAKLRDLLKEARISAAPALICLPRDKVVFKDVRYPKAPPQQEPMVVKFQAKKELVGSPDDMLMDYLPVAAPVGAEDCRATVVFVNKQVYGDLLVMCEAAGLKLAAITPRSFAVAAAYRRAISIAAAHPPDDATAPIAILTLTDRGGEFTVVHGNEVPFTRTVSASGVTSEAALIGEVKRSLAMFSTQSFGASIQAIYLTEGSLAGRSWSGRLQTSLPIPVYPFDPTAGVSSGAELPEEVRGRFVGAVGLLAARGESDKLPINFVSPRSPKAEPSKARTRALLATAAMVLLLGAGAVFGLLAVKKKANQVKEMQDELASLTSLLDSTAPEKKKLAAIDDLNRRRVSPLDVFYDITTELPSIDPDKMQLVEFSLKAHKAPVQAKGPGSTAPKPLTPVATPGTAKPGSAKIDERPVADLTLTILVKDSVEIERLKDMFKKDPHFSKIGSSFEGGSVPGAGDRTQYKITAELLQWPSSQFTRKLVASFPKQPKSNGDEPAPVFPEDVPNDFNLMLPGGNTP